MSVVGEVVGVIACVAAVVSAYRDGGHIIQKIKVKRAQKRAAPPSRLLEESIDQAPEDIEREKQRGISRFGKAFEAGDTIAVIALQQITIQLQGSLLEELRNAAFDDAFTDFRHLVDVADAGRDKSMNTLIELRQRLLTAEPIHDLELSPTSSHATARSDSFTQQQRRALPASSSSTADLRPTPAWAQANHAASRDASGEEDAASGAENLPRQPTKRGSFLHFLRHARTNSSHGERSGVQTPAVVVEEGVKESPQPESPVNGPTRNATVTSDARSSVSAGSSHSTVPSTTFKYQPWEGESIYLKSTIENKILTISQCDDPAKIWGTKNTAESPEMVAADPMSNSPPPVQRTSSGPAMLRNSSVMVPTPTPDNHYLGFCKNAVRLQNGDRGAFEKHNEHAYSRSGYSSVTIQYLACRSAKCSFMGQLKADKIWERVWKDEPLGLKWRWAFLAKSHVQQKQVKGQQFAYQCIFCTFATGKGAVYHSTRMYMEHVATHRGEMSEVLKYKTGCLNDRICNDEEEFDINLFPLDGQEKRDRQASQCLSDDLQGLAIFPPKPEPADSMFGANEPWNEGLSNFHYRSDLDPTELE